VDEMTSLLAPYTFCERKCQIALSLDCGILSFSQPLGCDLKPARSVTHPTAPVELARRG
jgi:hypothetical protein